MVGRGLLVLLLAIARDAFAQGGDWVQELKLELQYYALQKANNVPKGFTCSRRGPHDHSCHCWNDKGKHGEYQSDCNEPKQCVLYDATTDGDFQFDSVPTNGSALEDKLTGWKVPPELVAEYKVAALTTSADFRTFDFVVNSSKRGNITLEVGQFEAHVGSLRNYNGTIYLGYIFGSANGTLVKPYKRTARAGHCNGDGGVAPRGFNPDDLSNIDQGLSAYAFVKAAKLASPQGSMVSALDDQGLSDPIPAEFDGVINGFIKPEIVKAKAKLEHDCNVSLVTELGKHRHPHPHPHPSPPTPPGPPSNNSNISSACELYDLGFDHYGSKVNRQVFSGLPDAKSDAFLKILAGEVNIPEALQPAWLKAVASITKADTAPAIFTSLACDPDKEKAEDVCQFVVMMGKHDNSTAKSDIVLVQVNADFGINITEASQPVLDVQETSAVDGSYVTKPVVTQYPAGAVSQLMEEYLTFFQAVAFENVISSGGGYAPKRTALVVQHWNIRRL